MMNRPTLEYINYTFIAVNSAVFIRLHVSDWLNLSCIRSTNQVISNYDCVEVSANSWQLLLGVNDYIVRSSSHVTQVVTTGCDRIHKPLLLLVAGTGNNQLILHKIEWKTRLLAFRNKLCEKLHIMTSFPKAPQSCLLGNFVQIQLNAPLKTCRLSVIESSSE